MLSSLIFGGWKPWTEPTPPAPNEGHDDVADHLAHGSPAMALYGLHTTMKINGDHIIIIDSNRGVVGQLALRYHPDKAQAANKEWTHGCLLVKHRTRIRLANIVSDRICRLA